MTVVVLGHLELRDKSHEGGQNKRLQWGVAGCMGH